MKAWLLRRWIRMNDYVKASHTVIPGLKPPAPYRLMEVNQAKSFVDIPGKYFYPRAYRDLRHFFLGLIIPFLVAFLGGESWWLLGIWWGPVAVALIQLGGTVRELKIGHGLRSRLVDQPIRQACGLFIPVGIAFGPIAGAVALVGWMALFLVLIPKLD